LVTAAEAALTEKKGLEEAAKKVWDDNKKKYDDAVKADAAYANTDAGKALNTLVGENKTAFEGLETARKDLDTKLTGAKTKRDNDITAWEKAEDERVAKEFTDLETEFKAKRKSYQDL